MIRWLRVVLPSGRTLPIFAVLYAIFEGSLRLLEWRLGARFVEHVRPGTWLLGVFCLSYATFRATYFHPFYDLRYGKWLRTTPWTSSKPLPLGPVHLVWQDGVVLVAMALLAYLQGDLNPLRLLTFFLAVYLAWLSLSFQRTGQWAFAYAMWFGLGMEIRLWHHPWADAAAAVLLYPVAYVGLRQSLAKFPWDVPSLYEVAQALSSHRTANPAGDGGPLGWPFDRLRPKWPAATGIRTRDAILLSLLAGWWLYAVAALSSDPGVRLRIVLLVHGPAVAFLVLGRLVAYCAGYAPPISFWGRLWTGRVIIPGYDKVFLAPLAVVLIGWLLPELFAAHGLEPEIGVPLSLSLALLAGLSIGPSLLNWRLTGRHRLVPGTTIQQQCIKVG
jgi:hypothetical protein